MAALGLAGLQAKMLVLHGRCEFAQNRTSPLGAGLLGALLVCQYLRVRLIED